MLLQLTPLILLLLLQLLLIPRRVWFVVILPYAVLHPPHTRQLLMLPVLLPGVLPSLLLPSLLLLLLLLLGGVGMVLVCGCCLPLLHLV
jgi:hypothetical protein